MALHHCSLASFTVISPFTKEVSFHLKSSLVPRLVKVKGSAKKFSALEDNQAIVRRSADYHPSIWKYEFVQSLTSEFTEETYARRLDQLNKEIKAIMSQFIEDPLKQLELIDTLQRLGISYHFESEIKNILKSIYNNSDIGDDWKKNNLYAIALEFRLLRQHEFKISQEVFNGFMDEKGNFNASLCEDAKGMLSLYEASYLLKEGENVLEKAKHFTTNYLEKYISWSKDELQITIVKHALELPLHWRMQRLEARWFIDIYKRKEDMNPIILEMAKLDFNIVQSIHQEDLKYAWSWWKSTGLGEKLSFARDRLTENFLWATGFRFEPQFGYYRRMTAELNALITTIDDVYDVYGTIDELELFTNAVERWDIAAMDKLPYYMKVCFLALHNSINEMIFTALRDQEVDVSQYLKKVWVGLCKAYLLEAKWYHSGYKPTLEEYLENAWLSISGPLLLNFAYVFVTSPIIKEDLESLNKYVDIIRGSGIISRLADDLGTSTHEIKRGDVPKSIQCYMNETGVSEDSAREYVWHLIYETWKKLNGVDAENSIFPQIFIEICKNIPRMAKCMYQYGDGHAIQYQETKDRVLSLFIQPIPYSLNVGQVYLN